MATKSTKPNTKNYVKVHWYLTVLTDTAILKRWCPHEAQTNPSDFIPSKIFFFAKPESIHEAVVNSSKLMIDPVEARLALEKSLDNCVRYSNSPMVFGSLCVALSNYLLNFNLNLANRIEILERTICILDEIILAIVKDKKIIKKCTAKGNKEYLKMIKQQNSREEPPYVKVTLSQSFAKRQVNLFKNAQANGTTKALKPQLLFQFLYSLKCLVLLLSKWSDREYKLGQLMINRNVLNPSWINCGVAQFKEDIMGWVQMFYADIVDPEPIKPEVIDASRPVSITGNDIILKTKTEEVLEADFDRINEMNSDDEADQIESDKSSYDRELDEDSAGKSKACCWLWCNLL